VYDGNVPRPHGQAKKGDEMKRKLTADEVDKYERIIIGGIGALISAGIIVGCGVWLYATWIGQVAS
jgi:hypothetical protein